MDMIERIEVAVIEAIKADTDSGFMRGSYTFEHAKFIDCDGSIPVTSIVNATLAAIRETHAIVPRKLIDDLADANSGGDWGEACDAITAWAREHAGAAII